MKKTFISILGILGLIIPFSCELDNNCDDCFTPPSPMVLEILTKTDSTSIFNKEGYNMDSVSISYIDSISNTTKSVKTKVLTDTIKHRNFVYSNEIATASATGYETFFLKLSNADTDTIYLDIDEANDGCCTFFLYRKFKYNGRDVTFDNEEYIFKFIK